MMDALLQKEHTSYRRLECCSDVGAWLRGLGLEQYEPAFLDNRIDAEILPKLSAEPAVARPRSAGAGL
jgi:hypothetical protein